MNWNRALSALVAVIYLVIAAIHGGAEMALKVAMFLILPLACIWFSDAMGSYTGFGSMLWSSYPTTQQSPGVLVCIMGWVVLLLPVIAVVIIYVSA
jgi:hypothetical protein